MSDKDANMLLENVFGHLAAALFLAFFGAVYEHFSFGVYSYYIIYAFASPLTLGALPFLSFAKWRLFCPGRFAVRAWNSGIAALSVGCVFKGVLDIYGTTNRLLIVYPIAGTILLGIGLISGISEGSKNKVSMFT